jgi:type I restriction enzyme, S subunit
MREGWEIKKLKEVCDKITDGTHQTPKYFDEGVIFLSSRNVTTGKINWENIKFIDEKQHLEMHKRVAPRIGDILLAKNGTTGIAAMVDRDVIFDIYVSLAHIRSLGDIIPEYMLHFINSPNAKSQFNKRLKGIGVPNLHLKEIREVEITYPKSLQEQQQIIAILDDAFTAIDQAKANIEKNIENAKELFQSKLNEIFSQKGEGWVEAKLIDVNKFIDYRGKTPKKTEEGIRLITAKNVRMGYMREDPKEYINPNDYDAWMTRGIPRKNDVLFTTEAPLANVTLLNTDKKIALAQRIITLCPNREILSGEYLAYCLQSKEVQDKILEKGTGATVTGIKSRLLKEILIPIASKGEQDMIIDLLTSIKEQSQSLEKHYLEQVESLDELKKSILQKAFAGELTNKEIQHVR